RTLELRSSAQRLAAAARFARDQAIHRQRFFQLEIDREHRTVSVLDVEKGERRSFELPASVQVEKVLPEEGSKFSTTRQFLFSPDGGSPPFQVVLGNQSRQVTVSADLLTGFPKVSGL
ncbi:MAG: GspH/FimT family pseudopilin, partial [Acidobacteria bacterium]|nr:GspH/FimT family pseudopilin [Acidobacteriota bacterium]